MDKPQFDIDNSPISKIFELYGHGLNLRQIADQLGLHNTVVSFVIKNSNAMRGKRSPNRTHNSGRPKRLTLHQSQQIKELAEHHTAKELAEILKLPIKTVYTACYRLGVKTKRIKIVKKMGGRFDNQIRQLAPTHTKEQIATIIDMQPHSIYLASKRLGVSLQPTPRKPKPTQSKPTQSKFVPPKKPTGDPVHTMPSTPCEDNQFNHLIVFYKGRGNDGNQNMHIPLETPTNDKDTIIKIVNQKRPRRATSADIDCYRRDGHKYSPPHRIPVVNDENGELVHGVEWIKKTKEPS